MHRNHNRSRVAVLATGILLSALLPALLLAGCGKGTVRPETVAPGFTPSQLRDGTLWIMVDTAVVVDGMEDTFDDVFGSGAGLAAFLGSALRDSLARGLPAFDAQPAPAVVEAEHAVVDTVDAHPERGAVADVLPTHNAGHIARLTNLRIARTTRTLPTANLPSGTQPGVEPAGGGTSEGCELVFDLELRDNGTGALRARYRVTGQADVPLHAYRTALREAVQASVRASVRLLRAD